MAWSERFVDWPRVARSGGARVHVKLDSGMGRLGTRDVHEALGGCRARRARPPELELAGAMTHLATADDDRIGFLD